MQDQQFLKKLQEELNTPPITPAEPYAKMLEHPAMQKDSWVGGLMARDRHIPDYGFVLLSLECVEALAGLLQGKKVLEVGSGTGWLSHLLKLRNIDILASDKGAIEALGFGMRKTWALDHTGSSLPLLPGNFDVILMCWPPYQSSFATRVAKAMKPGQLLIYEGEGQGGCTADDRFFELLRDESTWRLDQEATRALRKHHLKFQTMHDTWSVWAKQ